MMSLVADKQQAPRNSRSDLQRSASIVCRRENHISITWCLLLVALVWMCWSIMASSDACSCLLYGALYLFSNWMSADGEQIFFLSLEVTSFCPQCQSRPYLCSARVVSGHPSVCAKDLHSCPCRVFTKVLLSYHASSSCFLVWSPPCSATPQPLQDGHCHPQFLSKEGALSITCRPQNGWSCPATIVQSGLKVLVHQRRSHTAEIDVFKL